MGCESGNKLPSSIVDLVQRVISRNSPVKINVKAGNKVYLVVFHPLPENECVNISGFDISDQKEPKGKVQKSEVQRIVDVELSEIIDAKEIQFLMDDFYGLVQIPMSIDDLRGNVLVGVGWQDICTKFHRINPETCKYCVESSTTLSEGVVHGKYKLYKCKNNMWHIATPIMVGGQHVGNIISGQFFFDDEPLEYELFRSQARKYGFNEEDYIAAFEKVPQLSRKAVYTGMSFFIKLANLISKLSYSNTKLAQSLSEREVLLETLRMSEEKYRNIIETANEGIWSLDSEAKTTYVNEKMTEMLGYSQDEVMGRSLWNFVDEEFLADYKLNFEKRRKGINQVYELKLIRKDGSVLWTLISAKANFDKAGKFTGSLGMLTDITERKNAEEDLKKLHDNLEKAVKVRTNQLEKAYKSLKESEKGLAEAQRMAHIGNWVWDIETDKAYWSEEMYHIFGRDPQAGAPSYNEYLGYIHPDDRHDYENLTNKALNEKISLSIDFRIISDDGEERRVYMQSKIILNETNNPVQIKGIVHDITERKKAEEKIHHLANVVESSNDAIFTISLDGIVISCNKGAEQVYGYSPEEIIGTSASIPAPVHLKGEIMHLIEKVKQGERIMNYETTRLRKDEKKIYVSLSLSPVYNIYNKLVAISVISRDITERIEAEKSLAKADNARKKEIHHRIKNNLQVISSLLDLQAEKFNDKKVIEAFRESQNRVISMALIHEELHKGQGFEMLNFSSYVKKLADNLLLIYRLGSNNINLNMDLDQNVFFNMDTAVPLGIIINELVSNSLKHAFPNRNIGEIRIKLHREEGSDTIFILIVSDNGVGIPEDIKTEELDSLGLQLVTTLVDQLDGELELNRDNGTEFIIKFAVAEKNDQIPASSPQIVDNN